MAKLSDFISAGGVNLSAIALTDFGATSSNQTLDLSQSQAFAIEPTANLTLDFTGLASGGRAIAYVKIIGGGDHSLTFTLDGSADAIRWLGTTQNSLGQPPTLSIGTDRDVLVFVQRGTGNLVAYRETEGAPA